ncbi:MAG: hypothetical protein ABUL77_04035, partial [Bacteroidota bacterium]
MRTLPPIAIAALLGFLPGAAWATRAAPQDNAGEVSEDVAPALEPPSESDLMLEALKATRGESPNSARIERVAAEVRSETKRKRSAETKALLVWKDPFAEDPDRSIPVQPRAVREAAATEADDGAARDGRARRDLVRALARARAETAVAQASAAAARAEAAKAKATAARVEASAARV